ncbi:MAG: hypothetical protein AB8B51_09695 [Sedimentitalea sp.]
MSKIWKSMAVAVALVAVPQISLAFTAPKGARVNPLQTGGFEVVPRGAVNSDVYWCAAASYARRVLGAPWRDHVVVTRGRGLSVTTGRRTAVQFTTVARANAGVTAGNLAKGQSMSVQRANTFCRIPAARL